MYLNPNSLVTGPNLAVTFPIQMQNNSKTMQVYSFSVTGVPSGVTATFNIPSITLGPAGDETSYSSYQSTPPTLTLTPGAAFTAPFTFNVVATPVGAPEFAISAPGTCVRPQQISIDYRHGHSGIRSGGNPVCRHCAGLRRSERYHPGLFDDAAL